jgi:signal transduction histidine kinase
LELGAWLIGGATSDGIATWSMHYTGMLALQLPSPLYLYWPTVLLSLMVSIAGCAAALWVVSRGALRWRRALAVSVFIGAIGISGLHYTAMAGISLPSAQHHQPFIVILAVIAAVAVSWTAVALTFLLRPDRVHARVRYHGGAILRGLANPIMHYTAMAGVVFTTSGYAPDLSHTVSIESLGIVSISVVPVMAIVVSLLVSFADRLQRQSAELRKSFDQARVLTDERERLARDLHDNIVQSIYALGMRLDGARKLIDARPKEAAAEVERAIVSLNSVLRDMRGYIAGPQTRGNRGPNLAVQLTELVRAIESAGALRFSVSVDEATVVQLSPEQADNLLQIAREALSNALRHSRARVGSLKLQAVPDGIVLEIIDDGVGFDPREPQQGGRGLRNVESRARQIGATVEIQSAPGHGTRVMIHVPAV